MNELLGRVESNVAVVEVCDTSCTADVFGHDRSFALAGFAFQSEVPAGIRSHKPADLVEHVLASHEVPRRLPNQPGEVGGNPGPQSERSGRLSQLRADVRRIRHYREAIRGLA